MTHYEVLGVDAGASPSEVKRAYLRRARRFHPDAHIGSDDDVLAEAERAMAEVSEAWQALRDPERRRRYDARLAHDSKRADADAFAARRRRPQAQRTPAQRVATRPRRPERPKELTIGVGFRPYLGSATTVHRAGRPSVTSLAVDGATDLRGLRDYAPDRLFALHAAGSRFADAELANLLGVASLRVLDLSGSAVGDAGMVHVGALTGLETLLLHDTTVTDRGLELLAGLTGLRTLGLGSTVVTDRGAAVLARFERLRVLQLHGTEIAGPGLRSLDRCQDLELVSLPWRVRGRWRRHLRRTHPGLTLT